jgi:hypothetical protein
MFAHVKAIPSEGRVCISRLVQSANEDIEAEIAKSRIGCFGEAVGGRDKMKLAEAKYHPRSTITDEA